MCPVTTTAFAHPSLLLEGGCLTIEFAADGFDPIVVRVNSKDYGQIEEGDELSINVHRNVTINSELRLPL
jgi:hypothetical protein